MVAQSHSMLPWGLVTSHLKSSAGVSSTTILTQIFLLECLHVTSHMRLKSRIKIDELNFGGFMVESFAKFANVFPHQSLPLYGS